MSAGARSARPLHLPPSASPSVPPGRHCGHPGRGGGAAERGALGVSRAVAGRASRRGEGTAPQRWPCPAGSWGPSWVPGAWAPPSAERVAEEPTLILASLSVSPRQARGFGLAAPPLKVFHCSRSVSPRKDFPCPSDQFTLFIYLFLINFLTLFIFGCVGSSLLRAGFL